MSPFVQLKVLFIGVNESSRQELFNHAICFKKFQNISRVVKEELKSKNIPLFPLFTQLSSCRNLYNVPD